MTANSIPNHPIPRHPKQPSTLQGYLIDRSQLIITQGLWGPRSSQSINIEGSASFPAKRWRYKAKIFGSSSPILFGLFVQCFEGCPAMRDGGRCISGGEQSMESVILLLGYLRCFPSTVLDSPPLTPSKHPNYEVVNRSPHFVESLWILIR